MSDHSSIPSDSDDEVHNVEDLVTNEPMFYVLGQFLETQDGKNVATLLQELTNEIRRVANLLSKMVQK
jgi:hypothetical protein